MAMQTERKPKGYINIRLGRLQKKKKRNIIKDKDGHYIMTGRVNSPKKIEQCKFLCT